MKKKIIWIITLLLIISALVGGFFVVTAPIIEVTSYLVDYCVGCGSYKGCATCEVELAFKKKYTNLIKQAGLEDFVKLVTKNTVYHSTEPLYVRLEEYNLNEDTEMPIVFVGDTILYSDEMIEENLIFALNENLTLPLKLRKWLMIDLPNKQIYDTTNKIIYFSMEDCPDCAESDAYLESLSKKLNLYIYADIENISQRYLTTKYPAYLTPREALQLCLLVLMLVHCFHLHLPPCPHAVLRFDSVCNIGQNKPRVNLTMNTIACRMINNNNNNKTTLLYESPRSEPESGPVNSTFRALHGP